jgi:hypothetical protein
MDNIKAQNVQTFVEKWSVQVSIIPIFIIGGCVVNIRVAIVVIMQIVIITGNLMRSELLCPNMMARKNESCLNGG